MEGCGCVSCRLRTVGGGTSGRRDSCDRIGVFVSVVGLFSGVAMRRSGDAQS
jgi:hypothetical protein